MKVYTLALAHVSCPGLHVYSFSDKGAAIRCAAKHLRAMYADRRKMGISTPPGRVTLANWEEKADDLDEWEGDGYCCVQWFEAELDERTNR